MDWFFPPWHLKLNGCPRAIVCCPEDINYCFIYVFLAVSFHKLNHDILREECREPLHDTIFLVFVVM